MYCHRARTKQHWPLVILTIIALSLPALPGDFIPGGPCTRGRPTNNGVTILTDWGTLMRGACWCGDCHGGLPSRDIIHGLKSCGLNSIHVYLEKNDGAPVGSEADNMDMLVEWCRQESLYIVMTFGDSEIPGYGKVDEFWRFYAPRYADQPHVVYEAKNEGEEVVVNSINWYRIIREGAPDTHILFGSYSNLMGTAEYALNDIRGIGNGVDWSNASIAFHGYGMTGDFQKQVIHDLNAAGYATTNTEFPDGQDNVSAYEDAGISYFHFNACDVMERICGHVSGYSVSYQPDFGDWPQAHVDRPEVGVRHEPGEYAGAVVKGGMYRLMPNGIARGASVQSVYDLWGRLLWKAPVDPAGGATGEYGYTLGHGASQMLIVR